MPAEPYRTTFELEKALEGRWPYNDSIRERLIATARRALELESELAATKAELVAEKQVHDAAEHHLNGELTAALRERDEARAALTEARNEIQIADATIDRLTAHKRIQHNVAGGVYEMPAITLTRKDLVQQLRDAGLVAVVTECEVCGWDGVSAIVHGPSAPVADE